MKVYEFISIVNSYQSLITTLGKSIYCGDEDWRKHVENIKLKDISEFISSVEVIGCPRCHGKGIIMIGDNCGDSIKTDCPECNGFGGYFKQSEIDCDL